VPKREVVVLLVFLAAGLALGRSCFERVNASAPLYELPTR
jgi:hypothetical protein